MCDQEREEDADTDSKRGAHQGSDDAFVADHHPHLPTGHPDRAEHADLPGPLVDGQHQRVDDPEQADDDREREEHVKEVEELVDRLLEVLLELVAGLHFRVGEPTHVVLQRLRARVVDPARGVDEHHLVLRARVVTVEERRRENHVAERGTALRLLVRAEQAHVRLLPRRELNDDRGTCMQMVLLRVGGVGEEACRAQTSRYRVVAQPPIEVDDLRQVPVDGTDVVD